MREPEIIDVRENGEEETVSIADYLNYWGCDPCYDKAPRNPGDGYIFYNYSIECNDQEYLEKLVSAIQRQLKDRKLSKIDRENFKKILKYVKNLNHNEENKLILKE